ncbi:MAG TPA: hypothetical protein VHK27_14965, partial [Gammaproteobacteria bacterium]|nr:hypothetical protein [Gammaproteobacteria bacterium]
RLPPSIHRRRRDNGGRGAARFVMGEHEQKLVDLVPGELFGRHYRAGGGVLTAVTGERFT